MPHVSLAGELAQIVDHPRLLGRLELLNELRESLRQRGGEALIRRPGSGPSIRVYLDDDKVRLECGTAPGLLAHAAQSASATTEDEVTDPL